MDWRGLGQRVLAGAGSTRGEALSILESRDDELLDVLAGAFAIRRAFFGTEVRLHLIQNARSGLCGEDCAFCSQSVRSEAPIDQYGLHSVDEILAGAREAARLGAMRYCIVTSGRGVSERDVDQLCEAVRAVKREVPIEVCTSLGLLDESRAQQLKGAGVDRYNHNLETAERYYPEVCTTHGFRDRVATARHVKAAGMALCCGGIIGMGETLADRVDLAFALAEIGADSIPVNFLDPRVGTPFANRPRPSATECLRALAMLRYVNPTAEVRAAGGREACLGALQVLALYAANSIFTNGYLTTPGQGNPADVAMIEAAGFTVGGIVASGSE
jgi:biotin synthase